MDDTKTSTSAAGTKEPCIYCRREGVARTKEHVLQAAFGAAATLPTQVCAECNNAFSAIDKAFLEAVNFYYTGKNMLRGLGLGRTQLEDGTLATVQVGSNGTGSFPPQLFTKADSEWQFLGSNEADLRSMLGELQEPQNLKVTTQLVAARDGVPRIKVIRSAPNVYLVQGMDDAVVESFVHKLRAEGLQSGTFDSPATSSPTERPRFTFDTALRLEPFCRAMAKVALNFVCYRLGADIALRSQLDPIRRYARYGEGQFSDHAVPTLLNHDLAPTMDAFVTDAHCALLVVSGRSPAGLHEAVFIAVAGKTIGKLELTRNNQALPPGTWLLTRFARPNTVEDLTLPADLQKAVLKPEALGIEELMSHLPQPG